MVDDDAFNLDDDSSTCRGIVVTSTQREVGHGCFHLMTTRCIHEQGHLDILVSRAALDARDRAPPQRSARTNSSPPQHTPNTGGCPRKCGRNRGCISVTCGVRKGT